MREYGVSPLHLQRVAEVMETNAPVIPANLQVDGFFQRLADQDAVLGRRQDWPIVDDAGRLVGLITRGDLVRALEREGSENDTVLDAGSTRLVVAYEDELLEEATAKMLEHDIGRLPVVRRDDPAKLVGFLGRAGVMTALLQATREERVRDPGWLSARLQFLRARVARLLA